MPRFPFSRPLLAYANVFSYWSAWLWVTRHALGVVVERDGETAPIGEERSATLRHELKVLSDHCEMIDLDAVKPLVERTRFLLDQNAEAGVAMRLVEDLHGRLADQLTHRQFLYVSADKAHYYENPLLEWGDVGAKFHSAVFDIEEAGKCLALGRSTATVMHLMRVMEVGLKAVARRLRVAHGTSWETYLRQINDRINAKYRTKGVQWKRDEPFFREVLGDLQSVKNAWRNPTMHVDRRYEPEEAEEVYRAARTFMMRIATRLHEPRR